MTRLRAASLEEIKGVKGVGAKIAESVYETLRHPAYVAFIEKLEAASVNLVMRTGVQ
jgi:NAD-dependent DNA ligase